MGLKKKSKVSAEFNMSSLTDIIFLLLIFFMLTSSLIVPNALNLKLPGKKSSSPPSNSKPTRITMNNKGTYYLNGANASFKTIEKKMRQLRKSDKSIVVVTPGKKTPNQYVVKILDSAFRNGVTASLTPPQ